MVETDFRISSQAHTLRLLAVFCVYACSTLDEWHVGMPCLRSRLYDCRLGSIARKHGSYASCVRMTNTLYGFNAMEVQEAFVKIREQVGCLLLCRSYKCIWYMHMLHQALLSLLLVDNEGFRMTAFFKVPQKFAT